MRGSTGGRDPHGPAHHSSDWSPDGISAVGPVASAAGTQVLVASAIGAGMPLPEDGWLRAVVYLGGACWLLGLRLALPTPGAIAGDFRFDGEREAVAAVYEAVAGLLDAVGSDQATVRRVALTAALDHAQDALTGPRLRRYASSSAERRLHAQYAAALPLAEAATALAWAGEAVPGRASAAPRRLAVAVRENGHTGPLPAPTRSAPALRALDDALLRAAEAFDRGRGGDLHTRRLTVRALLRSVFGAGGREYGLRVALCFGASVAVAQALHHSHWYGEHQHWYWLPATAVFLVKPDLGPLVSRVLCRAAGTVLGALVFAGFAARAAAARGAHRARRRQRGAHSRGHPALRRPDRRRHGPRPGARDGRRRAAGLRRPDHGDPARLRDRADRGASADAGPAGRGSAVPAGRGGRPRRRTSRTSCGRLARKAAELAPETGEEDPGAQRETAAGNPGALRKPDTENRRALRETGAEGPGILRKADTRNAGALRVTGAQDSRARRWTLRREAYRALAEARTAIALAAAELPALARHSEGAGEVVAVLERLVDTTTACAVHLDDSGRLTPRHIRRLTELLDELGELDRPAEGAAPRGGPAARTAPRRLGVTRAPTPARDPSPPRPAEPTDPPPPTAAVSRPRPAAPCPPPVPGAPDGGCTGRGRSARGARS